MIKKIKYLIDNKSSFANVHMTMLVFVDGNLVSILLTLIISELC